MSVAMCDLLLIPFQRAKKMACKLAEAGMANCSDRFLVSRHLKGLKGLSSCIGVHIPLQAL